MLNSHPMLMGIFLGLLGWMCLATIVRACTLPRGVSRGGSCGGCGYEYSGWARCPECGGAVGDVGVVTPSLAYRLRASGIGTMIGLVFVAFAATFIAHSGITMLCESKRWSNLQRQALYMPVDAEGPPCGMLIQWDVIGDRSKPPTAGRISIVLDGNAAFGGVAVGVLPTGMTLAEIDARTGRYEIRDANGERVREGELFDAAAARVMLDMARMPMEDEDLAVFADQIARTVDHTKPYSPNVTLAPGKQIMYNGSSGVSTDRSLPFTVLGRWGGGVIQWMSVAVGAFVFAVASMLILWRRKRIFRRPEAGVSPV